MVLSQKQNSLFFLYKSLYLMLISFGESYPDILINFANIARVYQQNKDYINATKCYIKAIEILSSVNKGKYHINISFCYSSLASLSYEFGDLKKSIDYQNDSVSILENVNKMLFRF